MRHDDIWSDDDPAVRRLREAMALRPVQEPAGRPETADPSLAAPPPSKAERVSALVARIRAGDLSAVEILRDLIGR